jgi:hypothetical protein
MFPLPIFAARPDLLSREDGFPGKRAPLQQGLDTKSIISQPIVKINKKVLRNRKLLVQYHGLLLMCRYSGTLLCKRILAGQGVALAGPHFFVKLAFYFMKKSNCPDVKKKLYLRNRLCAL